MRTLKSGYGLPAKVLLCFVGALLCFLALGYVAPISAQADSSLTTAEASNDGKISGEVKASELLDKGLSDRTITLTADTQLDLDKDISLKKITCYTNSPTRTYYALTVAGDHTLTLTEDGIEGSSAFTLNSGSIVVRTKDEGIYNSENGHTVTINGGSFSMNGLDSNSYGANSSGGIKANGPVTINGGTVTLSNCSFGIKSGDINIKGGTVNISTKAVSSGPTAGVYGSGIDGRNVSVTGGTVTSRGYITASYDVAIGANANVTVYGCNSSYTIGHDTFGAAIHTDDEYKLTVAGNITKPAGGKVALLTIDNSTKDKFWSIAVGDTPAGEVVIKSADSGQQQGGAPGGSDSGSGSTGDSSDQQQSDTPSASDSGPGSTLTSSQTAVQEPVTIVKIPVSVKAKASKNKVTVTWKAIKKTKKTKKLLAQIKSIQVQCSTDPTFAIGVNAKKVGKKKTKAVLKLKRKTTYYVHVRYVGADGYSNWSKAKKVKTK